MFGRQFSFIAAIACGAAFFTGEEAAARGLILADTLDLCGVQQFSGPIPTDGAASLQIGTYDASEAIADFGTTCAALTDPRTTFNPFSVNLFGAEYDEVHINENGVLSFGGAIANSPNTPLAGLPFPTIAPFFADGVLASDVEFGYSTNAFWLTWFGLAEEGGDPSDRNRFQVVFFDQGGGDFDLLFNYDSIVWDDAAIGAQAGFSNGNGLAYLLPGAGVAGAYLGTFDEFAFPDPVCASSSLATALACNMINDGTGPFSLLSDGTTPAPGYYLFNFRDGQAVGYELVPLPAGFALFLTGLAGLFLGRRKRT